MKTKAKSTITRITLAKLYNQGNYEHIRFEVTADVPKGGSASQTLLDLGAVLMRLKPIRVPYNYETAKAVLQKLPEAMTEVEKAQLDDYHKVVSEYETLRALRMEALVKLDDIGGTSKHTDGKESCDDCPF